MFSVSLSSEVIDYLGGMDASLRCCQRASTSYPRPLVSGSHFSPTGASRAATYSRTVATSSQSIRASKSCCSACSEVLDPLITLRRRSLSVRERLREDRAIGLDASSTVLADLDRDAPMLGVAQIRSLAPETWSFPELQTMLDAEIAAQCSAAFPALNLNEEGWRLTFCQELNASNDAWRFKDRQALDDVGADGTRSPVAQRSRPRVVARSRRSSLLLSRIPSRSQASPFLGSKRRDCSRCPRG